MNKDAFIKSCRPSCPSTSLLQNQIPRIASRRTLNLSRRPTCLHSGPQFRKSLQLNRHLIKQILNGFTDLIGFPSRFRHRFRDICELPDTWILTAVPRISVFLKLVSCEILRRAPEISWYNLKKKGIGKIRGIRKVEKEGLT